MADKRDDNYISARLTQTQLINMLIETLADLYGESKLITHVEVWLEGDEKPYINLDQRRISPDVLNILEGKGMYNGKKKKE